MQYHSRSTSAFRICVCPIPCRDHFKSWQDMTRYANWYAIHSQIHTESHQYYPTLSNIEQHMDNLNKMQNRPATACTGKNKEEVMAAAEHLFVKSAQLYWAKIREHGRELLSRGKDLLVKAQATLQEKQEEENEDGGYAYATPLCNNKLPEAWTRRLATRSAVFWCDCNGIYGISVGKDDAKLPPPIETMVTALDEAFDAVAVVVLPLDADTSLSIQRLLMAKFVSADIRVVTCALAGVPFVPEVRAAHVLVINASKEGAPWCYVMLNVVIYIYLLINVVIWRVFKSSGSLFLSWLPSNHWGITQLNSSNPIGSASKTARFGASLFVKELIKDSIECCD